MRAPWRINDARADESHHFPHCMLLTGVVTQVARKNAVGSKPDLFQAKNRAATAWIGVPAVCLSAEITAPPLWRTETLIIGFVNTLLETKSLRN